MNDYTGKICPFCKTEFKPGDEIVVCSACDMPHHKDCWIENQGCTTFGCLGTIKGADEGETSVTARQMVYEDTAPRAGVHQAVFCTRCGAQNAGTSSFCARCGNRLSALPPTVQTPAYTPIPSAGTPPYTPSQNAYRSDFYGTQGNSGVEELRQWVGVNGEYYLPKFREMKEQNKQTSWNWPAFLITPYWLIYRKMYAYGAGMLAGLFVLSRIGSTFLPLLSLAAYIVMGIFGNGVYMKFLEGKAAQAKTVDEPFRSQFIAKNGGVNTTAAVLTAVGYYLLIFILLV